jgi:arylsulfatase
VVFLSDNGGCAEIITDRWPRSLHMPLATRDGRPVRRGPAAGDTLGSDTSYASYGVGWANASNTPFRQFKHYIHEGGISTPLVVAWPSGIAPAVRGTVTPQVGHIKDLMPTFLELAGVGYPETFRGHALTPLEGRSLAPVFRGATVDTGPLFWEHHGNRGVRDGRWKLVAEAKGAWELYDLSTDRGEQRNLASAQPERVRELLAAYAAWAQRVGVVENPPRPRRRDSGG